MARPLPRPVPRLPAPVTMATLPARLRDGRGGSSASPTVDVAIGLEKGRSGRQRGWILARNWGNWLIHVRLPVYLGDTTQEEATTRRQGGQPGTYLRSSEPGPAPQRRRRSGRRRQSTPEKSRRHGVLEQISLVLNLKMRGTCPSINFTKYRFGMSLRLRHL